jgi:hypothetical protein
MRIFLAFSDDGICCNLSFFFKGLSWEFSDEIYGGKIFLISFIFIKVLKDRSNQFFRQLIQKNRKFHFASFSQFLLIFCYSHPLNVILFRRQIQIPLEIIFAATNFKNIKDDYSGKFGKFSEKAQSGVSYFDQK